MGELVKRVICGAVFALLSALLIHPVSAASSEVGVVLMHGKWGSPQGMLPIARDLEAHWLYGEQCGNAVVRPSAVRRRLSGSAQGNRAAGAPVACERCQARGRGGTKHGLERGCGVCFIRLQSRWAGYLVPRPFPRGKHGKTADF